MTFAKTRHLPVSVHFRGQTGALQLQHNLWQRLWRPHDHSRTRGTLWSPGGEAALNGGSSREEQWLAIQSRFRAEAEVSTKAVPSSRPVRRTCVR